MLKSPDLFIASALCLGATLPVLTVGCAPDPKVPPDTEAPVVAPCPDGTGAPRQAMSRCSMNSPPKLDEPTLLVDGRRAEAASAPVGSALTLLVSFADRECNLRCGEMGSSWNGPGASGATTVPMPAHLECEQGRGVLTIPLNTEWSRGAGAYHYVARIEDGCRAGSNLVEGDFSLMTRKKRTSRAPSQGE